MRGPKATSPAMAVVCPPFKMGPSVTVGLVEERVLSPWVVQGFAVVMGAAVLDVVQGFEVVMGAAAVLDIIFEEHGVEIEAKVEDIAEVAEGFTDVEDDTGASLPA